MKYICFLNCETNGLHQIPDYEPVSTKNLYGLARPIAINYIIGKYHNGSFTITKKVREIFKPKCINFNPIAQSIHKITYEEAEKKGLDNEIIMSNLKKDLYNVNVIVGHSLGFHLRALQVELFRTCTNLNFAKYKLIDLISFYHKYGPLKLKTLSEKVLGKSYEDKKPKFNTTIIKKIFLKLYSEYEDEVRKSIKE